MVITVLVVNGQLIQVGGFKHAAAFGADRAVDLQRFSPVVGVAVRLSAHLFEDGGGLIGVGKGDCPGGSCSHPLLRFYVSFLAIVLIREFISACGYLRPSCPTAPNCVCSPDECRRFSGSLR